jgi:DNA polymerase-3 subunit epsilon
MRWLSRWLDGAPQLSLRQQQRLAAWHALPPADLHAPFSGTRCVVVDVETSGLNLMEDRLISIGAVAMVHGQVALGEGFSVVLQQPTASHKDNILLHGIGAAEQANGVPCANALLDFLEYLGKDPLIAFHVTFDQTMIQRAIRQYLGYTLKHPWLDMAYVLPALNPPLAARCRSLDDWTGHFGIRNDARHNAQADALVTAQLFQVGLAAARKKNLLNFTELRDLEKAQRWVDGLI